jgi:hypothetical protein
MTVGQVPTKGMDHGNLPASLIRRTTPAIIRPDGAAISIPPITRTSARCISSNGGADQRSTRGSYGNNDLFFCLDCSISSASLRQVRAISISIDCILKFAARSAVRSHSIACCRHSTDVIIVAFMTPHTELKQDPDRIHALE